MFHRDLLLPLCLVSCCFLQGHRRSFENRLSVFLGTAFFSGKTNERKKKRRYPNIPRYSRPVSFISCATCEVYGRLGWQVFSLADGGLGQSNQEGTSVDLPVPSDAIMCCSRSVSFHLTSLKGSVDYWRRHFFFQKRQRFFEQRSEREKKCQFANGRGWSGSEWRRCVSVKICRTVGGYRSCSSIIAKKWFENIYIAVPI